MPYKNEIGVCVDYGVAYLLEEKNDENLITIIKADDIDIAAAGEKPMRKDHAFFKKIFDTVRDYDKISLFGPASAKNEILQRIRANKLSHIKIKNNPVEEKITENQRIDFINGYFDHAS